MISKSLKKFLLLMCAAFVPVVTFLSSAEPHSLQVPVELRTALDSRRTSLMDAIARGDASEVANHFSADARFIVPGFDVISNRDGILQAWRFALTAGGLARLVLEPDDVSALGDDVVAETGTAISFNRDRTVRDCGNYMLVWKREEGEWRIYRDIASPGAGPAPAEDRVGFPADYRTKFTLLAPPALNKQGMIQTAYGNGPAAALTGGSAPQTYPYGSILVMEFALALLDEDGKPRLDTAGNPMRGDVKHIDVMRREANFGEAYGKNRTAEWEYVSYRTDGSFFTAPARSASCAACHLKAGSERDFVFPFKGRGM